MGVGAEGEEEEAEEDKEKRKGEGEGDGEGEGEGEVGVGQGEEGGSGGRGQENIPHGVPFHGKEFTELIEYGNDIRWEHLLSLLESIDHHRLETEVQCHRTLKVTNVGTLLQ